LNLLELKSTVNCVAVQKENKSPSPIIETTKIGPLLGLPDLNFDLTYSLNFTSGDKVSERNTNRRRKVVQKKWWQDLLAVGTADKTL
jgi:hypothetical protein